MSFLEILASQFHPEMITNILASHLSSLRGEGMLVEYVIGFLGFMLFVFLDQGKRGRHR